MSSFPHIKHANRKVSKGISILTKLPQFVLKDVYLKLLFAFIQPHLDYGLLIWSSANKTNVKPVKTNVKDITQEGQLTQSHCPKNSIYKTLINQSYSPFVNLCGK